MHLSNRVLALIVLAVIGGVTTLMYLYFYVYYTSSLYLETNVEGYEVELYAPKIAQTFPHSCKTSTCSISDISPFEYILTIKKEGYVDFIENVDLKGAKKVVKKVELKKHIVVTPLDDKAILEPKDQSIQKQEKIDFLKVKSRALIAFDVGSLGVYYFEKKDDFLELFTLKDGKEFKIANFDNIEKENIQIIPVYTGEKDVIITLGIQNYLYNPESGALTQIDLSIPILYAKTGETLGEYQLITDKGTFLFYKVNDQIDYHSLFFDYIYVGDGKYVGYIAGEDDIRKKNFGFEKEPQGKPLLVYYDQNTFKKEVFYRLENNIRKLYKKGAMYIIEDTSGAVLEIKGL